METPLLFYWPTTLMLLDDNLAFLENLSSQLKNNLLKILYQNPLEALKALQSRTILIDEMTYLAESHTLNEYDEETSAKKLNYSALLKLAYEKNRFSIVSTVLVDYSMPELNGVEFCRKIKNMLVKKIMLTGEASSDLAVSAFNEEIIDSFVVKDIDTIIQQLNSSIDRMKQVYFSDIALHLMGKSQNKLKQEKDYLKIFTHFIRENNIKEYYQIDHHGSYLGFDDSGDTHWLVIRSESNFSEALDIAKHGSHQNSLSGRLQEKSHLLFLFSELEKKLPISSWNNFLFPIAQSFSSGGKQYYCTTIHDETFSLEHTKITSLQSYIEKSLVA